MRNLKKKDKSKTNSKVSSNAKSKYERSETFVKQVKQVKQVKLKSRC